MIAFLTILAAAIIISICIFYSTSSWVTAKAEKQAHTENYAKQITESRDFWQSIVIEQGNVVEYQKNKIIELENILLKYNHESTTTAKYEKRQTHIDDVDMSRFKDL